MSVKIKFTHQKFQEDAAKSICDVFAGQPFSSESISRLAGNVLSVWANRDILLTDEQILANVRAIQEANGLGVSEDLDGLNFTVEMETGTGKTYTYIKTIYELNRLYGWHKFIIVVPSIAIREGVNKTFEMTAEHFMQDYGKKSQFFIYDSGNLSQIRDFAEDSGIYIMIINSQAFNARDENSRRIRANLDYFNSIRPVDAIAAVRPIVIIDEPQSVEGTKTRESLRDFHPLFTLRYSATPREKYNLVYRLDAVDAYRQGLVKRIRVTGVSMSNVTASGGYVYLKAIIKSDKDPCAVIEYDKKFSSGIGRVTRTVSEGYDLFEHSGGLDEYRTGYIVRRIDALHSTVEFLNGTVIAPGEIQGANDELQIRRIQIRETINAHLQRERQLFRQGIKVLSLFFIDEVAKYRKYDEDGGEVNGLYAKIFEEEYREAVKSFQDGGKFSGYLEGIDAGKTHAGYFSIDKNNHMTNSRVTDKREGTTDDISAFDLIMRDKERLLNIGEPVRFIFSHSALREGWDNPNVFQICTLKNSTNDIRRRQEVGRGLRLCVNQQGERIHDSDINELTVIASESYRDFASGLQEEIQSSREGRPGSVEVRNAREETARVKLNRERFHSPEFREFWEKINRKSVYQVDFDDNELVRECAEKISRELHIARQIVNIERGELTDDAEFKKTTTDTELAENIVSTVRYDVIGRLVKSTDLTRKIIVNVLKSISPDKIAMFSINPEMFIYETGKKIKECADDFISRHIKYIPTEERYSDDIFEDAEEVMCIPGSLTPTPERGLYDFVKCDSDVEKNFASDVDTYEKIFAHVKLPRYYRISTPAGEYNPDWAIVFGNRSMFVAETKGSTSESSLRGVEKAKTNCAREYFGALGLKYEVVNNFADLVRYTY